MKLVRLLYRDRPYMPGRYRLVLKPNDWMIIATLLLLIVMAITTAPRSAAEAYRKLQALLLVEATPDWIATRGATGDYLPVSP